MRNTLNNICLPRNLPSTWKSQRSESPLIQAEGEKGEIFSEEKFFTPRHKQKQEMNDNGYTNETLLFTFFCNLFSFFLYFPFLLKHILKVLYKNQSCIPSDKETPFIFLIIIIFSFSPFAFLLHLFSLSCFVIYYYDYAFLPFLLNYSLIRVQLLLLFPLSPNILLTI